MRYALVKLSLSMSSPLLFWPIQAFMHSEILATEAAAAYCHLCSTGKTATEKAI